MDQRLSSAEPHPAMIVVAAALVDVHGRVLLQRRPVDRQHGGLWEFPGGKLETGEGPLDALSRELREELTLEIRAEDCVALGFSASEPQQGTRAIVLLLFGCRVWQGEPASQEGAHWDWFPPDAIALLDTPPLDVPLIPLAAHFARLA